MKRYLTNSRILLVTEDLYRGFVIRALTPYNMSDSGVASSHIEAIEGNQNTVDRLHEQMLRLYPQHLRFEIESSGAGIFARNKPVYTVDFLCVVRPDAHDEYVSSIFGLAKHAIDSLWDESAIG